MIISTRLFDHMNQLVQTGYFFLRSTIKRTDGWWRTWTHWTTTSPTYCI